MVNVVREHEDCLWERMTDVRSRVAAMVAAPLLAPLIKMLKQNGPPIVRSQQHMSSAALLIVEQLVQYLESGMRQPSLPPFLLSYCVPGESQSAKNLLPLLRDRIVALQEQVILIFVQHILLRLSLTAIRWCQRNH